MELEEQCREEEKQHWARVAALIQVHFGTVRFSFQWITDDYTDVPFSVSHHHITELNWFL